MSSKMIERMELSMARKSSGCDTKRHGFGALSLAQLVFPHPVGPTITRDCCVFQSN